MYLMIFYATIWQHINTKSQREPICNRQSYSSRSPKKQAVKVKRMLLGRNIGKRTYVHYSTESQVKPVFC